MKSVPKVVDISPKIVTNKQTPYKDKQLYDTIVARAEETAEYFTTIGVYDKIRLYTNLYNNKMYGTGNEFLLEKRPGDLTEMDLNDFFETVELHCPIVTGSIPSPDVEAVPETQELVQFQQAMQGELSPEQRQELEGAKKNYLSALRKYAENIEKELINIWIMTDMSTKVEKLYRSEFATKGKGHFFSDYNAETEKWLNEIAGYNTILPAKTASCITDCEDTWFIRQIILPVNTVKRIYGVTLEAEGEINEKENKFHLYDDDEQEKYKDSGSVRILECYLKDNSVEEFERIETDEKNDIKYDEWNKPKKSIETREAYPGLRKVTIARSSEQWIIEDTHVERIPVFEVTNYPQHGKYWGTSEADNLVPHMKAKNILLSNSIDNARLTGNPQKVKTIGCQEQLNNVPGATFIEEFPNSIRNLPPPNESSGIHHNIAYLDMDGDKKTGANDALRAQSQAGDSGSKVRALYSQAQGRLKPKLRAFRVFYRELFQYWADTIQQHYTEPIIHETETVDGEKDYLVFDPQRFKDIELKVRIDEQSLIPKDSYQEFEEAQLLINFGAISLEQLVDTAPTIDKERAKRHLKEMKEQAEKNQEMDFIISEAAGACEVIVSSLEALQGEGENPGANEALTKAIDRFVMLANDVPELIGLDEFKGLSPEIKIGIMQKVFEDDELQLAQEQKQAEMSEENRQA